MTETRSTVANHVPAFNGLVLLRRDVRLSDCGRRPDVELESSVSQTKFGTCAYICFVSKLQNDDEFGISNFPINHIQKMSVLYRVSYT